jgi:hypothetical protein
MGTETCGGEFVDQLAEKDPVIENVVYAGIFVGLK